MAAATKWQHTLQFDGMLGEWDVVDPDGDVVDSFDDQAEAQTEALRRASRPSRGDSLRRSRRPCPTRRTWRSCGMSRPGSAWARRDLSGRARAGDRRPRRRIRPDGPARLEKWGRRGARNTTGPPREPRMTGALAMSLLEEEIDVHDDHCRVPCPRTTAALAELLDDAGCTPPASRSCLQPSGSRAGQLLPSRGDLRRPTGSPTSWTAGHDRPVPARDLGREFVDRRAALEYDAWRARDGTDVPGSAGSPPALNDLIAAAGQGPAACKPFDRERGEATRPQGITPRHA